MQTALAPPLVQAATRPSLLSAALIYSDLGFSVLPLHGKRPALPTWRLYQFQAAGWNQIRHWYHTGQLQNIGLVCGAASGNLVVLDLDDPAGYTAFRVAFPRLAQTYTVTTGSGQGKHLYWRVARLPRTTSVMASVVGNLELLVQGRQIVAPPSRHPRTGQVYRVHQPLDTLLLPDVDAVVAWIMSFRPQPCAPREVSSIRRSSRLNPRLIQTLTEYFEAQHFKRRGTWLNGRCIYPQHHRHQDNHPSFGFNTATGYGFCFRCGTILVKDICTTLGIDMAASGGLWA